MNARDIRATAENVTNVNKKLQKKYKTLRKYYKASKNVTLTLSSIMNTMAVLKILWHCDALHSNLYYCCFCLSRQYKFRRFVWSDNYNWVDSVRWLDNQKKQPFADVLQKGVLKNFVIFTGKHLHRSLFWIKLQVLRPVTLLKRDSNTDVFPWILRNF